MKNENKETVSSDELMKEIVGQPVIDGFRKGVTKKSILKDLTEDDWLHLDKMKEAEDRLANKHAYSLFLKSYQACQSVYNAKNKVYQALAEILDIEEAISKNEVDISVGGTEQKDNEGKVVTVNQLKNNNMKLEVQANRYLQILILELSGLFKFVGHLGLDKKVIFTEEEYDGLVEDVMVKLKGSRYKIY